MWLTWSLPLCHLVCPTICFIYCILNHLELFLKYGNKEVAVPWSDWKVRTHALFLFFGLWFAQNICIAAQTDLSVNEPIRFKVGKLTIDDEESWDFWHNLMLTAREGKAVAEFEIRASRWSSFFYFFTKRAYQFKVKSWWTNKLTVSTCNVLHRRLSQGLNRSWIKFG